MSVLNSDWLKCPKGLKPWNYVYQRVAIKPT
jgi:hypothetical protein